MGEQVVSYELENENFFRELKEKNPKIRPLPQWVNRLERCETCHHLYETVRCLWCGQLLICRMIQLNAKPSCDEELDILVEASQFYSSHALDCNSREFGIVPAIDILRPTEPVLTSACPPC